MNELRMLAACANMVDKMEHYGINVLPGIDVGDNAKKLMQAGFIEPRVVTREETVWYALTPRGRGAARAFTIDVTRYIKRRLREERLDMYQVNGWYIEHSDGADCVVTVLVGSGPGAVEWDVNLGPVEA